MSRETRVHRENHANTRKRPDKVSEVKSQSEQRFACAYGIWVDSTCIIYDMTLQS